MNDSDSDSEPDPAFDAAAFFTHLREMDPEHDGRYEWAFIFTSPQVEDLESAADAVVEALVSTLGRQPDDVGLDLAESTFVVDETGGEQAGPPELALQFIDVLTEDDLVRLHATFAEFASSRGLEYQGVSNFDPMTDEDWDNDEFGLFGDDDFEESGSEDRDPEGNGAADDDDR